MWNVTQEKLSGTKLGLNIARSGVAIWRIPFANNHQIPEKESAGNETNQLILKLFGHL